LPPSSCIGDSQLSRPTISAVGWVAGTFASTTTLSKTISARATLLASATFATTRAALAAGAARPAALAKRTTRVTASTTSFAPSAGAIAAAALAASTLASATLYAALVVNSKKSSNAGNAAGWGNISRKSRGKALANGVLVSTTSSSNKFSASSNGVHRKWLPVRKYVPVR